MGYLNYQGLATYKLKTILPLYFPWALSCIISHNPLCSYALAWLGSFFIFFYSLRGPLKTLASDLPAGMQVMRPMILIQVVFAGLMSVSSIFYFLDHLGFYFWSAIQNDGFNVNEHTLQLAYCQRLYVFAHASLVLGMIIAMKPRNPAAYIWIPEIKEHLIPILVVILSAVYCLSVFAALNQFSVLLAPVPSFLGGIMILIGLRQHLPKITACGICFFCFTLYQAVYSGYKEALFVHLILMAFILYPYYRSIVVGFGLPLLLVFIYFLPIWTNTIRAESWQAELPIEKAANYAYSQMVEDQHQEAVKQNSWDFLTNRFSEINMFSKYVSHVPKHRPFYHTEILQNALYALIPRALWPSKPNTEEKSMERVYDAGVISNNSDASAKTRTVVDGYLSAGLPGILITMICYGSICQALCNMAERLFGGYEGGCIVVFNGMFQQLWRGNNFEFILNNILYGCILMLIIFNILRYLGLLIPSYNHHTKIS